jgi:hypothetical protein
VPIPEPLKKLDRNIVFACIQQGLFLAAGLLVHDGGMTGRLVLGSMLAYWMGIAYILSRHRGRAAAAASDQFFIRWGFLLLWPILLLFVGLVIFVLPAK